MLVHTSDIRSLPLELGCFRHLVSAHQPHPPGSDHLYPSSQLPLKLQPCLHQAWALQIQQELGQCLIPEHDDPQSVERSYQYTVRSQSCKEHENKVLGHYLL